MTSDIYYWTAMAWGDRIIGDKAVCMTFLHAGGARQENWNRQRILRGTQNTKRESEHCRKNSQSAIPKVNKAKVETLAIDLRREWVTKLE